VNWHSVGFIPLVEASVAARVVQVAHPARASRAAHGSGMPLPVLMSAVIS